jgi:signal transduction histidine kinase
MQKSTQDATQASVLQFRSIVDYHERSLPQRGPRLQSLDVTQLADEVLAQFTEALACQNIKKTVDIPALALVTADDQMLRSALFHLILNAVQAMPDGGELVVTGVAGRDGFELEIADSGPGLPDAKSVFDIARSKAGCSGLSLIQQVADAHGGYATATNCAEGGAAVTLYLPARALRAAA